MAGWSSVGASKGSWPVGASWPWSASSTEEVCITAFPNAYADSPDRSEDSIRGICRISNPARSKVRPWPNACLLWLLVSKPTRWIGSSAPATNRKTLWHAAAICRACARRFRLHLDLTLTTRGAWRSPLSQRVLVSKNGSLYSWNSNKAAENAGKGYHFINNSYGYRGLNGGITAEVSLCLAGVSTDICRNECCFVLSGLDPGIPSPGNDKGRARLRPPGRPGFPPAAAGRGSCRGRFPLRPSGSRRPRARGDSRRLPRYAPWRECGWMG